MRKVLMTAAALLLCGGAAWGAGAVSTSSGGTRGGGLASSAGFSTAPHSFDGGTSTAGGGRSLAGATAHYFLSRWYDLIDIVDFSIGAGPGFLVNVRLTKLAQIGGGWSDSRRIGFRGRSAGVWREIRKEVGVSLLYYQKIEREKIAGWVETMRVEKMDLDTSDVYADNNDRSFLGVGATVHVGVLVDVNARPMQAVDFVLGLFTIDVLDDDTGQPERTNDL